MTDQQNSITSASAAAMALAAALVATLLGAARARAAIGPAARPRPRSRSTEPRPSCASDSRERRRDGNSARTARSYGSISPHTRTDVPPRPVFGREAAPVSAVRVIDAGGGAVRIVIAGRRQDRLRDRAVAPSRLFSASRPPARCRTSRAALRLDPRAAPSAPLPPAENSAHASARRRRRRSPRRA